MRDAQPKTIRLKDYRAPDFLIDSTELRFELFEDKTLVHSHLAMRRNPAAENNTAPLCLDGQELLLRAVRIDGRELAADEYVLDGEQLVIASVPAQFVFECVTEIAPQKNTSLEGLYKSRTMFCTQCEAEGFRKITYFLDRPDVMSVYTVRIEAGKNYPVLLSNGNLVETGAIDGDRHFAVWHDPFKKPCYLFALVAGDLAHIEDRFTTLSGRVATLRIYVESKDIDKCDHAMLSLKHAMRWDEEVYGREYDLDIFNIVAVDDFNMGAMENKSLNIFNTSAVLAHPQTTTDAGFQRVEAIVAHEYFHNWSGNRVTCRDWFQLSLKEGFTVFRDAEFSADMGSRTVKRVEDVTLLRTLQFAEDAGPMAHPVRPDSYIEISNFYTLTVYEKGAEVVRMLHVLLGPELFRKGTDLYFARHDGQAVTCEDFVKTLEEASGRDLKQFRRWYEQAGTPRLDIEGTYDADARTYTLTVRQELPATPGQSNTEPMHIPLALALFGDAGALRLQLAGGEPDVERADNTELVLDVTQREQRFTFVDIAEPPVPSLLRGFSAPVKLHFPYSRDELMLLMSRDSDGFCRWDAGQQLAVAALDDMIAAYQNGETMNLDERVIDAFATLLAAVNDANGQLDPAMVALMLTLPSEAYLAETRDVVDVAAIHAARQAARLQIGRALREPLLQTYRRNVNTEPYAANAAQIAQRSLKNICLTYLMQLEEADIVTLCREQFERAENMTDRMAALAALVNSAQTTAKARALEQFYERWQAEALVVNQWFQVQATATLPGTLEAVQQLMQHPAFDIKNPNKVRALIGAFAASNAVNFHRADGAGYRFLADQIIVLNGLNPQIAARQLTPLTKWKKYSPAAQQLMIAELRRIAAQPDLSRDVYEVVSKSLVDAKV
ncbi:MAG TPA: aminopeptidase N [Spongiibacteraceae bacterium]|nr:aminopeptidase N [Spongiibacteraceae bacterium]